MPEKIKILIIDDDEVDRATVKRSLRTAGMEAETIMADSASAGLKFLKEQTFDCLLIDFKLPDMDGLELLTEIRKINNVVPVLLVTSYGDERVAAEAIKMGASDYISKAMLTPEGISHSLRNAIRLARIEEEKRTAEESLKDTQSQLQTIIQNTPIVLWGVDNDGVFNFSAGKGLEFVGIKGNAAIGRSIYDVFKDSPDLIENLHKAMRGEIKKASDPINGFVFETLYRQTLNEKGEVVGLTGISFDITERVKSEKAMEKARDMAEESVRVKEQFFTNMSHEIRTPMNGIIGLTGILQKSELTEEQRTYLDAIRISSERLMVIINDLLDFSKIESGKISLEETNFDLRRLIGENLGLLTPKATERENRLKVIIDSAVPDEIAGDPVRLSQVLTNLIGNAIKFTEKGQIRILVENLKETNEEVTLEFEIQDTGIGIPEDKLATIFESFTQASNDTTRKYGGTGLGLTISRQLIEMQGGQLTVKSAPGQGSTFSFTLTFKKAAVSEKAAPKSEDELDIDISEMGDVRILLAEDNEINQLLAKKVISDWDFELDIAANGRIAIDMLKEKDYDVILMDMQMPEMDGYEATVYIRNEMGAKSNTPIIAFTAHATKTEIGRCMLAGANAYVSKPLKPNELLSEIYDLVMQEPGVGFKPEISETENPGTIAIEDINIDLSFLKEMAQGNEAFMEEILTMFMNTTPESLAKMQEALDNQNWDTLKAIAHRLKSSMFLIGIKELEMNMASIEQFALLPEERHIVSGILARTRKICELAIEKLRPMMQKT